MPETYASRCFDNIFNTVKVHSLHSNVARVSWSSVDDSCTCVTGVNVRAIQCCGHRLAEPEMQQPFVSGT